MTDPKPAIPLPVESFLGSKYVETRRYKLHKGIPVVVEVERVAPPMRNP